MTEIDVEAVRRLLRERLAELDRLDALGEEAVRPVELDQTTVGRLSRMDAMQVQAMAIEAERRRRIERARIDAALKRLDSGDYGYCVSCDQPIAPRRLELDPAVPTCVRCAGGG